MLIYSKERLVTTDVNMMVIRAKDNDGYFYIHRSLYDQAVILHDIYADERDSLIQLLTGSIGHRADADYFMDNVPSPINMFGAFLLLVKEEITEFVDMVGAIHVMSGPINLRAMIKIPREMRNTPTFSLSIKEEYELAWDRFFMNTMPYSEDMFFRRDAQPMNGTYTVTEPVEGALSNIGDDGVEYTDELEAILFGCDEGIFNMPEEEEEIEDKVPIAVQPAPVNVNVQPAPVTVQVVQQPAPAEQVTSYVEETVAAPTKTGLDLLLEGDI